MKLFSSEPCVLDAKKDFILNAYKHECEFYVITAKIFPQRMNTATQEVATTVSKSKTKEMRKLMQNTGLILESKFSWTEQDQNEQMYAVFIETETSIWPNEV